jgi:hypothetical protein
MPKGLKKVSQQMASPPGQTRYKLIKNVRNRRD